MTENTLHEKLYIQIIKVSHLVSRLNWIFMTFFTTGKMKGQFEFYILAFLFLLSSGGIPEQWNGIMEEHQEGEKKNNRPYHLQIM